MTSNILLLLLFWILDFGFWLLASFASVMPQNDPSLIQ
jgi:hypothetical protein